MKTITFNISDEKFIEHKERIIRLRNGDYQKYLKNKRLADYQSYLADNNLDDTDANKNEYIADNDLDDSNANQNEYVRLFCMHPVKNLLKRLEKEDEVQKSQVDIKQSDLT